jgi:hypothetical protein
MCEMGNGMIDKWVVQLSGLYARLKIEGDLDG